MDPGKPGFFAIVNHGIPQELIDESFRQTAQLFEIPMEEKLRHRVGFHHQGYLPPKASILQSTAIKEKIALNTKKDTNAAWLFMRNRTADDPKVVANVRHRGLNQWPESLPEFRKTLFTYQTSMERSRPSCCRSMRGRWISRPSISTTCSRHPSTTSAALTTIRKNEWRKASTPWPRTPTAAS